MISESSRGAASGRSHGWRPWCPFCAGVSRGAAEDFCSVAAPRLMAKLETDTTASPVATA